MPDFVILGNSKWDGPAGRGGNSSQQYAQVLLRRGWRVSFIQLDGGNKLTPLEEIVPGPETIVMCCRPWPEFYYQIFMMLKARGCRTIYRSSDNWAYTIRRKNYSEEMEIDILRAADVVVASNPLSIERFKHIRPDMTLLRNGVDLDLFWNSQDEASPDIVTGNPTAIFVASFWDLDWIDWSNLTAAARLLPKLSVNILGNVPDALQAEAPPNIHCLGSQPWRNLPAYHKKCDIGLVTYNAEYTAYNNSLKVMEYLASGLRVVCAPNESTKDYPYIFQYRSAEELASQIMNAAATPVDRDSLYSFLKQHTWDKNMDILLRRVAEVAAKEPTPVADPRPVMLAEMLSTYPPPV
jgi:glycosyltransferase involved in cell wall biosynthesis